MLASVSFRSAIFESMETSNKWTGQRGHKKIKKVMKERHIRESKESEMIADRKLERKGFLSMIDIHIQIHTS